MTETKKNGLVESLFTMIFEILKRERGTFEAISRMNTPYGTFR